MSKDKKPLGAYIFKKEHIELVHYKIIPDYAVENRQNEVIAKAISELYKAPKQRIKITLNPLITYTPKLQVYFNILLLYGSANFYISIPRQFADLFINKMQTIWNKSAIQKVDTKELQEFNINDTTVCNLVLKGFNFKSLSTDKGDLYPLTNLLGITKDLKANEKARIHFEISPIKRSNWVSIAKDEYKQYSRGKIIDNEKSTIETVSSYIFKIVEFIINIYIEFRILIFEAIAGLISTTPEDKKEQIEIKIDSLEAIKEENKLKGLSEYTHYKMSSEAFKTKISILARSKDINRQNIIISSIANSYKDLNGNNELVVKRLSKKQQQATFRKVMKFESTTTRIKSIYSDKEIAKFIQLPQKTLQQEYNLENIDTRELEVPIDLQEPGVEIGVSELKKESIKTYWCNDYNSMALSKVIAGPPGAGKTKYTERFIINTNKLGHCTIVFDYIKNCELSNNAMQYTKNNVVINLANQEEVFSFAYPELSDRINARSTKWERIETASEIAKLIKYLVNSISDNSIGPLSSPMARYLIAAAKVVFIHPDEKVDNVFKVLEDWQTRMKYIRKSKDIFNYNDRVLNTLRELNETDDNGKIIGTRHNLILGILNRIDALLDDPRLELMLKADIDNKHNFTKYMNEGKAIYIMMPQKKFKDPVTKDIIVTYFLTRIWSAALERSEIENPNICHIVTDEIHQIPTAASFFRNHITEFRKFGLAPFFTIHYLKQFRSLLDAVKSSGASYMLLAGLEKENILALKEEIAPFEIEEAMKLKPFHSLNIIRYMNEYARFITKLPKPIC